MPAMQEAPRPQPTGNIFERGLKAAARSKLVLPVVAAADIAGAVLGGAACGVQPRTSPSSEPPRSAEVRPTDPGATATAAAEIEKGRVNIPIIGKGVPAAPTPEPTPIPTPSPVEQAIEKGKIEIKTPAEWEKYFTLVSPSEARELLAQAKEKGEFKFLFPQFDVTNVKELVVENRVLVDESVPPITYLVVRGIPSEPTTFYSGFDGEASATTVSAAPPSVPKIEVQWNTDEFIVQMDVPKTRSGTEVPVGSPDWPLTGELDSRRLVPIKLGDPLIVHKGSEFLDSRISRAYGGGSWRERLGDWNLSLTIKTKDRKTNYNSGPILKKVLTKNSKIVMINPLPGK